MSDNDVVVRWYTRARKFPQLIGRTPDGTRLWGGPYTITQVVIAGALLAVGWQTTAVWARFGFTGNVVFAGAVFAVVIWSVGKIPVGSRNPLSVAAGVCRALLAPQTGRTRGAVVRIRRPHRVHHHLALALQSPPVEAAPHVPARLSATRLALAAKGHR